MTTPRPRQDKPVCIDPEIRADLENNLAIQVQAVSSLSGFDAYAKPSISRLVNTILRNYCDTYTPPSYAKNNGWVGGLVLELITVIHIIIARSMLFQSTLTTSSPSLTIIEFSDTKS